MNLKIKLTITDILYLYTVIACFLGLAFYNNFLVMHSLIAVECVTLLFLLLIGKNELYFCLLVIFITMSQEFAYFLETDPNGVTVMYSFKETRIAGINLGFIFTGLFFVKILLLDRKHTSISSSKFTLPFIKWLFVLAFIAIVVGAFNILINDNGISHLPNVWFNFIQESSYGLYIAMIAYCVIFVLKVYGNTVIEKILVIIMLCNLLIPLIASFMGIKGTYGGKELYLTLSCYILCMFIIIFPAYKKYNTKLMQYMLVAIFGILYPLFFKSIAFGKMLMLLVVILFLFLYLKSKCSLNWLLFSFSILFLVTIAWGSIVGYLTEHNSLFGYKYKQIMSLLCVWKTGWYEQLLPSPKVRITELFNIIIEFFHKPWFIITGKGVLGSVKDYMHDIPMFNLAVYSYNEFVIQSYYGVHETINIFLLQSGILGLIFIFKYIKILFCNIRHNPWIVIGSIWLLLLWGYSITRSTFGIISLCLGLYLIESDKESDKLFYLY